MKYIFITIIICINLFAESVNKQKYDKNKKEHVAEMNIIQTIIDEKTKNIYEKFKYQNLNTVVELNIKDTGEMFYKIIEKSKNPEYDKEIQNFIDKENGKIYYTEPILKKIRINFRAN